MTEPLYRPKVAIVGRPNVGKSTLFNRLVGRKLALVDDRPGVTRDRREGDVDLYDLKFTIVDTAGLEEADDASLAGRMRKQTEAAIAECDVILFVIDARAGLTPMDQPFAEMVRRSGKTVILIANKAEGTAGQPGFYEAYGLGLGDPLAFSAEHGEGVVDLVEALREVFGQPLSDEDEFAEDEDEGEDARDKPLRIAIVGRPNAGKSTLVNRILGEERMLTGPEAGITRDTISVDWAWKGRPIRIFDTAGLRRRARIEDKLEKLSVADALRAIRFAEVVVVLLDATVALEKQDLTIIDLIEREGRAAVIGLNKWDLVADKPGYLTHLREEFAQFMPQVRGAQMVPLSGLAGTGLPGLMQAIFKAEDVWSTRVSTSQINRWLEEVLASHPPPAVSGRRIKIRYMTQAKARPPTFALFGNQLDSLPTSYTRYLINSLREAFDLPGTPIRLVMRNSRNPFDKERG
jgi:GTP-binding protein